jgi:hypothetical protein
MSKPASTTENEDIRKVWNYVLPEHHDAIIYSPLQSIPPLAKQNDSADRLRKEKEGNH